MKTHLRRSVLLLCLVAACDRPETDLFTPGPLDSVEPRAGAGKANAGTTAVGGVESSAGGAVVAGGGTAVDGPSGGEPAASGGIDGQGDVGGSHPAGSAGAAGKNPGVSGSGSGGSGGSVAPPAPVCGNGKIEEGEECDDAGHSGHDGCDAQCEVVCSDYGPETRESEDHHCYAGFSALDFIGATQDCVGHGSHLATISSAAESQLASELVLNSKWIGAYEDVPSTTPGAQDYKWVTSEPFAYENWEDNEPDGKEYRCSGRRRCYEHCVVLLPEGTWADQACDVQDGYICEWEPAGAR